MPDFYYYQRCGTCRKAMKWLDNHHIEYTPHDLVKNPPSAAQLEKWMKMADLPQKRFFNTSGQHYRQQGLKDKVNEMSCTEACTVLSNDGMLIKRPIMVDGTRITVGFKEAEYEEVWNN